MSEKDFWDGYITEPVKCRYPKCDYPCLDLLDCRDAQQALECQHRWEEVPDKPIYKCARCGAFMVICK